MAKFGFEEPSIHGVHSVLAVGAAGIGAITFVFVNDNGAEVQLDANFGAQSSYVRDLALAINRVNDDYGYLSDDERKDLLPDTLLIAAE